MSTDPTLQPIAQEYTLTAGEGLIDVRGDGSESGLVVENRPMAIVWPDYLGSIGEYIVRSRNREGISERLRAIRQVAVSGIDTQRTLAEQVGPLLMLFASGLYRLWYVPSGVQHYYIVWDQGTWDFPDCADIYPEPDALIPTQRAQSLNSERVQYFEERIKLGCRPVAFATRAGYGVSAFLLDGHHKVRAYENLRVDPAVLYIERHDALPLTVDDGLNFVQTAHMGRGWPNMAAEYRRYKRQSGS